MSTYDTVIEIDTNKLTGPSGVILFELGVHPDYEDQYEFKVDWGDGTTGINNNNETVTGSVVHAYSSHGIYNISINGSAGFSFPAFGQKFTTYSSVRAIIKIVSWGRTHWKSFNKAFEDNTSLTEFDASAGVPDLSEVEDFSYAFKGCSSLVTTNLIEDWDTKNVTNFFSTFQGCSSFNGNIGTWNTSSAYNMDRMFEGCSSFTKDLSSWSVERILTKPDKFDEGATQFTPNLHPKWGVVPISQKARKTYTWRGFNTEFDFLTGFKANGFKVQNAPEYTWKINGGKGIVDVDVIGRVDEFFDFISKEKPGFIQCLVHDRDSKPDGDLIFQGSILEATTTIDEVGHAQVENVGYASGELDLNQKQLEDPFSGDTRKQYVDEEISDIFKDIIELYWNKGSTTTVFYSPTSVKEVGQNLSITFSNESYYEMLERLTKFLPLGWYWYIDGEGLFHLDETDLFNPTHQVYIGREVNNVDISVNFADIKNTVFFSGGELGNGDNLYIKYNQPVSQTSFGLKEVQMQDGRVTNQGTADLKVNTFFKEKSSPIRYIEFDVIDNNYNPYGYDIESIKPGDSISVLSGDAETAYTRYQNSDGTIGNGIYNESAYLYSIYSSIGVPFQIQEIQYKSDRVTIKSSDLITNQASTINQLRRQQEYERTKNDPDKPTDDIIL